MMAHALGAPGSPATTTRSDDHGDADRLTAFVEGRRLQQTHTDDQLERTVS